MPASSTASSLRRSRGHDWDLQDGFDLFRAGSSECEAAYTWHWGFCNHGRPLSTRFASSTRDSRRPALIGSEERSTAQLGQRANRSGRSRRHGSSRAAAYRLRVTGRSRDRVPSDTVLAPPPSGQPGLSSRSGSSNAHRLLADVTRVSSRRSVSAPWFGAGETADVTVSPASTGRPNRRGQATAPLYGARSRRPTSESPSRRVAPWTMTEYVPEPRAVTRAPAEVKLRRPVPPAPAA